MDDPIGAVLHFLQGIINFFQTVAPAGFGLVLIPLIVFGIITILVSTRR